MNDFDVIVVGGGPGGSSAATFIAMQGHRVLLLERERLPLYKIGESLLPSTVNGICAMLGVTDEMKRANFTMKYGGTFRWGRSKTPWTFAFSRSSRMQGPTSFAYQVERMKFDEILLNNARKKGVTVREGHAVLDLLTDGTRVCGVVYRDEEGRRHEARSRYVVDASGWTSTLARHVGERIYSEYFRNIAIFGYFLGAGRMPPPNSGNIFCAAFDKGWFWYIPLSPELTSVGAVIGQEYGEILSGGGTLAASLASLIGQCEPIRDLLANARPCDRTPYNEVRVRKDYSYCHTGFWREGLVLVGDAACFIDPVFSSGVHLSTYSALLAARSVNTYLSGRLPESRVFGEFEQRYRREFRYFYDFLISFYNVDQDLDSYYWEARRILNSPETANEAFVHLVGGVGGSGEPLFDSSEAYLADRASLSAHLFPSGDDGTVPTSPDPEGAKFVAGLFRELTNLQARGAAMHPRFAELPLFENGLVPSGDGLSWVEPAPELRFHGEGTRSSAIPTASRTGAGPSPYFKG